MQRLNVVANEIKELKQNIYNHKKKKKHNTKRNQEKVSSNHDTKIIF